MADRIVITLLVDNYVDIFLSSTEHATYPTPGSGSRLWGEQGPMHFLRRTESLYVTPSLMTRLFLLS